MKFLSMMAVALIGLASAGRGCIWYDGSTLEGNLIQVLSLQLTPSYGIDLSDSFGKRIRDITEYLRKIRAMPPSIIFELSKVQTKAQTDWPPELNEAVAPIFDLKFAEALSRLQVLDQRIPDNYYICANLGAALELSGQDAAALDQVEKALRLKSDAHYGTEWMHAAVLRAKLALAKDPKWLEHHTISGIPLTGNVPQDFTAPDGNKTLDLQALRDALVAHLVPRLLFIKGKDPIIAAMLMELARTETRLRTIEDGMAILDLADEYGAQGTAEQRIAWEAAKPGPLTRFFKSKETKPYVLMIPLAGVLLALCALVVRIRSRWAAFKRTL